MANISGSLPTQAHILEEVEGTEFPFPAMDAVEPTSSPSASPPSRSRSSLSRSPRDSLSPPPPPLPRHSRTRSEREHSGGRSKLLSRLISREERESSQVRTLLVLTTDRLENETRRADDAERRVIEVLHKLRAAHEATMLAQADVARANEELRMYKYRLEDAQREINRAQEIVNDIEQQRVEAEAEAIRARSTARKFREERLIAKAREEGRRQGYKEGLSRGKDAGYYEASVAAQEDARRYGRRPILVEQMSDDEEDVEEEEEVDGPQSPVLAAPSPRKPIRQQDWRPPSRSTTATSRAERRSPPDVRNEPIAIPRSPIRIRSPRHGPRPAPDPIPVAGPSNSRSHDDDPIVPIPVNEPPRSPSHPSYDVPPDNFIPVMDQTNRIYLPPPHELSRPVSPSSTSPTNPDPPSYAPPPQLAPPEPPVRKRDFAYSRGAEPVNAARAGVPAPFSPSSRTSTNISQYDLVSSRGGTSASSRFRNTVGNLASIIGSPSISRSKTPAGTSREDRRVKSPPRSRSDQGPSVQARQEEAYSGAGPSMEQQSERARSPLERIFRKKYRNRSSPSSSVGIPDIVVESPTSKTTSRPSTVGTVANANDLLSPETTYAPLAAPEETTSPRPLPALPAFGFSDPGAAPDAQLPPGFIPFSTPAGAASEEIPSFTGDRGADAINIKPIYRSADSPRPHSPYALAPIPPNVVYPEPPGRKATPRGAAHDGVVFPLSPPQTSPRRRSSPADALSPLSLRLSSPLR